MNLRKLIFTENACFKTHKDILPIGIMVHSTGANNPNLRRYVGPDDGLLGGNTSNNHWNQNMPDGKYVCPHGFIGKLASGVIATYQTLPWDILGWHSGNGNMEIASKNGFSGYNANFLGYIGFEICEDGLSDATYFNAVYTEAVELCAMLCKEYGLKPEKPVLICHSEGHALGIASNHADVMHWFPKYGKSMDTFRADVKKLLEADNMANADTYTVKPGDNLSTIGARLGLAWQVIASLNGIKSPYTIYPKQVLKLPVSEPPPPPPAPETVSKAEYDAVAKERDDLKGRLDTANARLTAIAAQAKTV